MLYGIGFLSKSLFALSSGVESMEIVCVLHAGVAGAGSWENFQRAAIEKRLQDWCCQSAAEHQLRGWSSLKSWLWWCSWCVWCRIPEFRGGVVSPRREFIGGLSCSINSINSTKRQIQKTIA